MENLKKLSVVGILILFAVYVFYQRQEMSSIQFATTEPVNNFDQETAAQDKKVSKYKNLAKTEEVSSQKVYIRPNHQKRISGRDASDILDGSYDEELFEKMAADYSKRESAEQNTLAVWDLNKKPQNHNEMQLYLEELRYVLLAEVEEALLKKDRQKALKFAGLHFGYTFLSVFNFQGYDEDGAAKIELPPDLQKIYAQNTNLKNKKENKTVVKNQIKNKIKKRKIAQESVTDIIEALSDQKLSQISYYEDLKNPGSMDASYEQNNSKFSALTDLMESLIEKMEGYDSFNIFKSPTELHDNNKELIKKTILEIRKFPQRYGLSPYQVKDITDVEFSVLADALLRTASVKYALAGAVLNVGVGLITEGGAFLKTNPIFKGVSLLGEGLITALGCYQGAKSMILLQRYYTFMKDKKEFFKREGKDFFPKETSDLFDVSKVYNSIGMKREINKAWAWGLGWGLANKFNIGSKLYHTTTALSGYLINASSGVAASSAKYALQLSAKGVVSMYASSNTLVKAAGKMLLLTGGGLKSAKEFIVYAVGKATLKMSFMGKLYKFVIGGLKKIPGVTKVTASLVDAGVTGVFVYTAVYTRLSSTKSMLDRIHFSPEVAIYLSLDSKKTQTQESFLEASRKTFYPVCHFFALRVNNFEKNTVVNSQKSDVKASNDKKIEGCLTSIATFEGLSPLKVEEALKKISDEQRAVDLYSLYYKDHNMPAAEVQKILQSIQRDYPAHYRMVWITALKAIYPIDKVPDEFYLYKDLLILGNLNMVNGFFDEYISISTYKSAEYINTDRFTYTIEQLVFKANELRKVKTEAKGWVFNSENEVTASDAFALYWKYFKDHKVKTDEVLKNMIAQEELSWWRKVYKGLDEAARGLKWMLDDMRALAGQKTFGFRVDSEIETILKDF